MHGAVPAVPPVSTDGDDVLREPPALTLRWVIVVALVAAACSISDSAASDPPTEVERSGVSGEIEDPAAVGAPGDSVDVDGAAREGPSVGPGTALEGGGVEGTSPTARRPDEHGAPTVPAPSYRISVVITGLDDLAVPPGQSHMLAICTYPGGNNTHGQTNPPTT